MNYPTHVPSFDDAKTWYTYEADSPLRAAELAWWDCPENDEREIWVKVGDEVKKFRVSNQTYITELP